MRGFFTFINVDTVGALYFRYGIDMDRVSFQDYFRMDTGKLVEIYAYRLFLEGTYVPDDRAFQEVQRAAFHFLQSRNQRACALCNLLFR